MSNIYLFSNNELSRFAHFLNIE